MFICNYRFKLLPPALSGGGHRSSFFFVSFVTIITFTSSISLLCTHASFLRMTSLSAIAVVGTPKLSWGKWKNSINNGKTCARLGCELQASVSKHARQMEISHRLWRLLSLGEHFYTWLWGRKMEVAFRECMQTAGKGVGKGKAVLGERAVREEGILTILDEAQATVLKVPAGSGGGGGCRCWSWSPGLTHSGKQPGASARRPSCHCQQAVARASFAHSSAHCNPS